MTEPATEAGRRLLDDWNEGNVLNRLPRRGSVAEQIAAIEQEARADLDVERLARALLALRDGNLRPSWHYDKAENRDRDAAAIAKAYRAAAYREDAALEADFSDADRERVERVLRNLPTLPDEEANDDRRA